MKKDVRFSVGIYKGPNSWTCSIHDLLQHRHFTYYQPPSDLNPISIPRKRFTRRFIIDLIDNGIAEVEIINSGPYQIIKYAV